MVKDTCYVVFVVVLALCDGLRWQTNLHHRDSESETFGGFLLFNVTGFGWKAIQAYSLCLIIYLESNCDILEMDGC